MGIGEKDTKRNWREEGDGIGEIKGKCDGRERQNGEWGEGREKRLEIRTGKGKMEVRTGKGI